MTPSYNQGQFLEETIRSVLLQGYPNLEYIVIDGGSTDNSVEIIKRYSPWLNDWISEPDKGQSDALNKGFSKCSGKIGAYLNSDDTFLPRALEKVALVHAEVENFKWVASPVLCGESLDQSDVWKPAIVPFPYFVVEQSFGQAGVFWNLNLCPQPYFDIDRHFGMDHKFFAETYLHHGPPILLNEITAFFRRHQEAKTWLISEGDQEEHAKLILEMSQKVDAKTAIQIKNEALRQRAKYRSARLLAARPITLQAKWQAIVESGKILIQTPEPFRDRTFFSALLRLMMRLPN
ncbi:MAG: glycosyltransferase family 2 protein [Kovacikia sp.]